VLDHVVTRRLQRVRLQSDVGKGDRDTGLDKRSGTLNVLVGLAVDHQLRLVGQTSRSRGRLRTIDRLTPQGTILGADRKRSVNLTTLGRQVTKVEGAQPEVVVLEVVVHIKRERLCRELNSSVGERDVRTDDQVRVIPLGIGGRSLASGLSSGDETSG